MQIFLTNHKNQFLILLSVILYTISFLINSIFDIPYFLYISGFFFALFIPGLVLKNIIDPNNDLIGNIIAAPIFTIFFFVPFYYLITSILHGKINFIIIFVLILVITIVSAIQSHKKRETKKEKYLYDKHLLFGIGAFLLIHLITTLAYRFVPEIDGYKDILRIDDAISSGIFDISYRPLFTFFATYLSLISQISPYWLFKFGLIIIQLSSIYYLYRIIKSFGANNSVIKYLTLLTAVSVPVINLEIDYIRPNVIFIATLFPFVYYLANGLSGNKKFLMISTVLSTIGILYHEFFVFLFALNIIFVFLYFWKEFTIFKKLLTLLFISITILILLSNIEKISTLQNILNTLINLMQLFANGISWKWWYMSTYLNMDGNNLGWIGLGGAIKFYAYFLSPFLFLILIVYPYVFIKKLKQKDTVTNLEKVSFSILMIGLIFAEFFPRIDFKTLPDRFWPIISMSLILLTIPVLSHFKNLLNKKIVLLIILLLLVTGIGGSVYIAKVKAGYTSSKEYKAATWIKNNTPKNSLFITQGGNGAMLDYFAKRKNIVPTPSFFLLKSKVPAESAAKKSEKILKNINDLFQDSLKNPTDQKLSALNSNLKAYNKEKKDEELTKNLEYSEYQLPAGENIYILYSFDKFNNYYSQRKWWQNANFQGADLTKFNDTSEYELVYNDNNIVYIWKKIN
ncbi:MAG: hypothetical protein WC682_02750 [Parcubacteria group bacterium]|jgi:hypothetical protein